MAAGAVMTIEAFWQLVEQSRATAVKGESRVGMLDRALTASQPREIVAFEGHCWDLLSVSFNREIWAAATIIQPSCTANSFEAARAWTILEGKEFFEQVCEAPERLADRAPRGQVPWLPEGEMLLRLAPRVYRKVTGEDLPTLPRTVPYVLKGQRWTEYDLPEMFPDLWRKYRL
jgi:hypothetical protein